MWKDKINWCHDDFNIKGFFDEYRFLCNFHLCPVKFEGVIYPSSENAYMASKSINPDVRKQFETVGPKLAKQLGRLIELRQDFNLVKNELMTTILRDKFTRNGDLKKLLLNTGNRYLEETNWWDDIYWGVCNDEGFNTLGKVLMDLRTEFQKEN